MRKIFVIILAVLLFLGVVFAVFFLETLKKRPAPSEFPSPTIVQRKTTQGTTAPVNYDKANSKKLLEIAKNKPPLSVVDSSIREALVNSVGGTTASLYSSPLLEIAYVKTPNDFEGEIKTSNIPSAKEEAYKYFRSKGLSDDGICKLPFFFYLGPEAFQALKESKQPFKPLPDFCE